MNPYAADPGLYGQYYHSIGEAAPPGPHGAYAAYYNAAAYASAQSNAASAAQAVAVAAGQPTAAIPAYATPHTTRAAAHIVQQVAHNPQRALTTIHPTPPLARTGVIKQGRCDNSSALMDPWAHPNY